MCPASSKPYILRQKPVECRSNEDCMPTFECIRNESYLIGYCCSKTRPITRVEPKRPISHVNCLNGNSPLKTPDGEIQLCIPNKQSGELYVNCTKHPDYPYNYNCVTTFRGNYCCKSLGIHININP